MSTAIREFATSAGVLTCSSKFIPTKTYLNSKIWVTPRRLSIDKDNTTVTEDLGKKSKIEAQIGQICTQVDEATSDYVCPAC